jgi:hypothetical protein
MAPRTGHATEDLEAASGHHTSDTVDSGYPFLSSCRSWGIHILFADDALFLATGEEDMSLVTASPGMHERSAHGALHH